jgi:hypothetical protein
LGVIATAGRAGVGNWLFAGGYAAGTATGGRSFVPGLAGTGLFRPGNAEAFALVTKHQKISRRPRSAEEGNFLLKNFVVFAECKEIRFCGYFVKNKRNRFFLLFRYQHAKTFRPFLFWFVFQE